VMKEGCNLREDCVEEDKKLLQENDLYIGPTEFTKNGPHLGDGCFGLVSLERYQHASVAIKQLTMLGPRHDKYIIGEMVTLSRLRHPNIVALYGLCIEREGIFILTEYVYNGSLAKNLACYAFNMKLKLQILVETAAAMNYLHSRNIMHRDLKSANLLLTEGWHIKLCDFGFSKHLEEVEKEDYNTLRIGTMAYMAPEVLYDKYNNSVDVYSFGVVMYEVLKGEPIVDQNPQFNDFPQPKRSGKQSWDLMHRCLWIDWTSMAQKVETMHEIVVQRLCEKFSIRGLRNQYTRLLLSHCALQGTASQQARPMFSTVVKELEDLLVPYANASIELMPHARGL